MDLASTIEGFFQDEVERAFREEGLAPGVMVEHYVVQLLAGYAVQQIESTRWPHLVRGRPRRRRARTHLAPCGRG